MENRLRIVLNYMIHTDQKGFIPGRNISESNRLLQDIIFYTELEDLEWCIIFFDKEKGFDRIELGWVDLYVLNFDAKLIKWVHMLLKDAKTCIDTNGHIPKYFQISRSARQGVRQSHNLGPFRILV